MFTLLKTIDNGSYGKCFHTNGTYALAGLQRSRLLSETVGHARGPLSGSNIGIHYAIPIPGYMQQLVHDTTFLQRSRSKEISKDGPWLIRWVSVKRRNSIANALELRLSCTKPSIWEWRGLSRHSVDLMLTMFLSNIRWFPLIDTTFSCETTLSEFERSWHFESYKILKHRIWLWISFEWRHRSRNYITDQLSFVITI